MRGLLLLLAAPAWAQVMTLEQAVEKAASASPVVQQSRVRALEQQSLALVERAALRPQLNVNLGQTYQTSNLQGIGLVFPGMSPRVGPYRVMDVRPRLTQTVLDLSLLSRFRAEQERAGALREEAASVAERTRLAVVDLYLNALLAGTRARASQARVETAQAVLRQAEDAERAGTGNRLDVARAAQRLESERVLLSGLKRDQATMITMLKRTIGMEQSEQLEVTPVAAAGVATMNLDSALQARPEMRALAARRRVLELELQAAERERWPKVSAFGDYGVLGQDPSNALSTFTVGVSATVPVWTGGRIENSIKAARRRMEQWEKEKRALALQVEQELAQAALEREAAQAALAAAARAAAAARKALELARLRQGAGLAANLDVVTAQGEVAQAEESELRTRYEGHVAAARLAAASGDVMAFERGRYGCPRRRCRPSQWRTTWPRRRSS
jgi:outer membrane protein TolC